MSTRLLLPGYPPEIFFGQLKKTFQLAHSFLADVAGAERRARLLQEPDRFLVVGLGDIEGVFKSCLVKSFVVHATSVVPIPG